MKVGLSIEDYCFRTRPLKRKPLVFKVWESMEADGRASVTEIEGEEQTATTTKNMVEPAGLDTSLDEMTGGGSHGMVRAD